MREGVERNRAKTAIDNGCRGDIFRALFRNMANTKSAAKRARQTKRRTETNRKVTTAVKVAVKKVRKEIASGQTSNVAESFRAAASKLDKAVKTGQVHRNKANRLKSRLAKQIAAKAGATSDA